MKNRRKRQLVLNAATCSATGLHNCNCGRCRLTSNRIGRLDLPTLNFGDDAKDRGHSFDDTPGAGRQIKGSNRMGMDDEYEDDEDETEDEGEGALMQLSKGKFLTPPNSRAAAKKARKEMATNSRGLGRLDLVTESQIANERRKKARDEEDDEDDEDDDDDLTDNANGVGRNGLGRLDLLSNFGTQPRMAGGQFGPTSGAATKQTHAAAQSGGDHGSSDYGDPDEDDEEGDDDDERRDALEAAGLKSTRNSRRIGRLDLVTETQMLANEQRKKRRRDEDDDDDDDLDDDDDDLTGNANGRGRNNLGRMDLGR